MEPKEEAISDATDYLRNHLEKQGLDSKATLRTMMIAEETLAQMVEKAEPDSTILIDTRGHFGNIELRLRSKGAPFDIGDIENRLLFLGGSEFKNEEAKNFISRIVERLFWDSLSVHNDRGVNRASISVKKSPYAGLILTMIALVAGIATGLLIRHLCPESVANSASLYVFEPIFTMFMSALKMIVAPLVFCSIAASIANFGDARSLGRIAAKIMVMYVITAIISMAVSYAVSILLPLGDPSMTSMVSDSAAGTIATGKNTSFSILDTIVNIIPTDIMTPFQKGDMLQLIFMAVAMGITGSVMSHKAPGIKNAMETANKAFSTIASYLIRFIPLVVFCSMAKMMTTVDPGKMASVFLWVPESWLGFFLMIVVYLLLLLILGRLNPIVFLKKWAPGLMSAFSTSSSNASIPTSMKTVNDLGVSPGISSFSIPLGATLNMAGTSGNLIISAMFMARIYGVTLTGDVLFALFLTSFILSLGCPGISGAGLVCIAVLLPQIGVPAEAVSLIMGVYPLCSMAKTASNVTGDAVITTIIARQEKKLDMEKYNA